MSPAVHLNSGDVAVKIEIGASQNAAHIGAQSLFVIGKGRLQELDPSMMNLRCGRCIAAIKSEYSGPSAVVTTGAHPVSHHKISSGFTAPPVALVA
jgi:hypothetical protein